MKVYATLLTNDGYLPGVQVLVYSIRKYSQLTVVILVSNDPKAVTRATIL